MSLVSEYDSDFAYLHFPDDQGIDSLPLLLFSDQIDGSFGAEKALYDELCVGDTRLTPASPFDSGVYSYRAWSLADSPLESSLSEATSPATTIDPATLSSSTLSSSLPSSPCVKPEMAFKCVDDGHTVHTTKYLRTRYDRDVKQKVNYCEDMDEGDEYEPKPDTRSPKRARRVRNPLSTPELDSDVSSLPSTPLSTSARTSRPTLLLPRHTDKHKPKGNRSNSQKDHDSDDDFQLGAKSKKSQCHRPRGTGDFQCTVGTCTHMFRRVNDRNRHETNVHGRMDPDQRRGLDRKTRCTACDLVRRVGRIRRRRGMWAWNLPR
ncbi:hypothetical protein DFS33DRAFT_1269307 [Desarmillaria ectypa]|nr:hypothetical protein DFS33DRAFT_1269307 [Desarmillaria ectypa]